MLNNKYYLIDYYKEDSRIHKLEPKTKILTLLIMIISIIISQSIHNIVLLNLYILTMILYSNIALKIYLTNLLKFKILILVIAVLSILITLNIPQTLYLLIKVIDIIILLITLIMTTTPLEINQGLTKLLDNKIINMKKMILKITLFLIAIPLIHETKEQIKISKALRGESNFNHNNINNFKNIYSLTKLKMQRIYNMMELKKYSYSATRTYYKSPTKRKLDKVVMILNIVIFILVIIY